MPLSLPILFILFIGVQILTSCSFDNSGEPPPSGTSSSSIEGGSSSSSDLGGNSSSSYDVPSSSSAVPSSSSVVPSSSSIAPSSSSSVLNSSSSQGVIYGITVTYGNETYPTVVIGTQTWFAKNLNYDPGTGTSACYNNETINCDKYGRLYDWETANTVCPSEWHLPSDAEWTTLENYVGNVEGTKLKATSGWVNRNSEPEGNGTDNYGFAALPGGLGGSYGFYHAGSIGYWWSDTEYDVNVNYAYYRIISYNDNYVRSYSDEKSDLHSVRCVKN